MSKAMDDIEVEARAYIEGYSYRYWPGESIRYLRAMLKIINELRAPPGADAVEHARRMNAGRPPLVLGNPHIFSKTSRAQMEHDARALQQYGDERADEAVKLKAFELACAPPGADAMEREDDVTRFRAVQQYGDERAAAATEVERRRCATIDHIDIDLIRREAREAAIEELPGDDVMERARQLYNSARFAAAYDAKIVRAGIARAMEQYGDERAAATIEEAAHFIWLRFGVRYEDLPTAIRALKPSDGT